jgi:hypothetical protein
LGDAIGRYAAARRGDALSAGDEAEWPVEYRQDFAHRLAALDLLAAAEQ